jgi:hypothetical protein
MRKPRSYGARLGTKKVTPWSRSHSPTSSRDLYEIYNEPTFGTRAYLSLEEAAQFIDKENDPYRYAQLVFERGRLFMRMHFGIPIYAEDAVAAFEDALEIYRAGGYLVETASALLHWGAPAST